MNYLREFGKFRLDPVKRVLWLGDKPVNLPLKQIEMLCVLTENSGAVVTKNDFLERVWPDSFVEEGNLSHHIYALRKTFKELGSARGLIQTVSRRGYRFTGEVREIHNSELVIEKHTRTRTLIEIEEAAADSTEDAQQKPHANPKSENKSVHFSENRNLLLAAAAVLLSAALVIALVSSRNASQASALEIKSIAVLPFSTIDPKKENEYESLGLADLLITRLSIINKITVRPTGAVAGYANTSWDAVDFGRRLNVDAVLEGTIYRTSDRVRITVRLIKTSDGLPLWSGQFEKPLRDEMRLQDEIALQVVNALDLTLNGGEKEALAKRYTQDADAYQLYIKGRYEWNKRSWEGMIEAGRLFRNAIARDPDFALAYVGLADTVATSNLAEARNAIQKALELDSNLAEAHASNGFLQMFHLWQWREAETSFKKSIKLNSNYATAHHWYAQLLAIEGRNEEAKAEMRLALEINPLSHNFLADLGQIYYFSREYKEAEEYCRRALNIHPDFIFAHECLEDIYLKTGEYDKAVEAKINAHKINSTFANESVEQKNILEEDLHKKRKTYREGGITKFVESLIGDSPDSSYQYVFATRHAFLGEKQKALGSLEKAFEGRAFLSAFVKADPVFDGLRSELRYQEILRNMNLPE